MLPMNYKELVLEKFPSAQVWKDAYDLMYIDSCITSKHKKSTTEAWQAFYEQYCTNKPDLIIGEIYTFSNDGVNYNRIDMFTGYADNDGNEWKYIRPIQNNPKLDQLKQLAEELGYNLTKQ